MLYTIIPPVLVVLSLAAIIVFLVKRSDRVAKIEKARVDPPLVDAESFSEEEDGRREKMKKGALLAAEKIIRKLKIFFLKLENIFSGWGESLRKKRNSEKTDGEQEEDFSGLATEEKRQPPVWERHSEERLVPLESGSGTVSEPETAPERDAFEKILIERIAANPKDLEAYERLGDYYMDVENWNYAKECFKQVIKLSPGKKSVKTKMRKLERLLGK